MLKTLLIAGAGGFAGSVGRYLVSVYLHRWWPTEGFPLGTFAVNLAGSLFIGFLYGISEKNGWLTSESRIFLATGFCGGFTTFSAFSYESLLLLQNGQYLQLSLYLTLSIIAGIALAGLGYWLA